MLFALLPSIPNKASADNNAYTFQGQYTAPACGPRHNFVIGPNTRTIDIVASTVPVNDIVLKLNLGTNLTQTWMAVTPFGAR